MNIKDYGLKENLIKNINKEDIIARIIATHKDRYEIVCNNGHGFAKIKRGLYYDNPNSIYSTTGDFVLIEWNETGDSMIIETLKRESSFSRTASSSDRKKELHSQHEQLVASNFDYVFIIQSLNNNFNINRIERYLIMLPNGAMIIDTPGMRELGMWDAENGINKTFQDIEQYFGMCKYTNCTHTNEPGCRILQAIENDELDRERFEQYVKLQKESEYNTDSEQYLRDKKEKFKEISKINKRNKNR